ncbi:MAG: hypothetical protein WCG06_06730, partial [Candidatus Omnitrophota bacterium]
MRLLPCSNLHEITKDPDAAAKSQDNLGRSWLLALSAEGRLESVAVLHPSGSIDFELSGNVTVTRLVNGKEVTIPIEALKNKDGQLLPTDKISATYITRYLARPVSGSKTDDFTGTITYAMNRRGLAGFVVNDFIPDSRPEQGAKDKVIGQAFWGGDLKQTINYGATPNNQYVFSEVREYLRDSEGRQQKENGQPRFLRRFEYRDHFGNLHYTVIPGTPDGDLVIRTLYDDQMNEHRQLIYRLASGTWSDPKLTQTPENPEDLGKRSILFKDDDPRKPVDTGRSMQLIGQIETLGRIDPFVDAAGQRFEEMKVCRRTMFKRDVSGRYLKAALDDQGQSVVFSDEEMAEVLRNPQSPKLAEVLTDDSVEYYDSLGVLAASVVYSSNDRAVRILDEAVARLKKDPALDAEKAACIRTLQSRRDALAATSRNVATLTQVERRPGPLAPATHIRGRRVFEASTDRVGFDDEGRLEVRLIDGRIPAPSQLMELDRARLVSRSRTVGFDVWNHEIVEETRYQYLPDQDMSCAEF